MSRKRSRFEPAPTFDVYSAMANNRERLDRRVNRVVDRRWRAFQQLDQNEQQRQLPYYRNMARLEISRMFGLHNWEDRHYFAEESGRLNAILTAARRYLERRAITIYTSLRRFLPFELVSNIIDVAGIRPALRRSTLQIINDDRQLRMVNRVLRRSNR